jgi:hypothetical protein
MGEEENAAEKPEEKKSMKQKLMGFVLDKLGASAAWNKVRNAGSGYGTYLVSGGTLLTGLGCLWMELHGHDLDWILSNLDQIKNGNCMLMISVGFTGLFLRRSNAKIEAKLDAQAKNGS